MLEVIKYLELYFKTQSIMMPMLGETAIALLLCPLLLTINVLKIFKVCFEYCLIQSTIGKTHRTSTQDLCKYGSQGKILKI